MGESNFYGAEWFVLLLLIPLLIFLNWRYLRHQVPVLIVSLVPQQKRANVWSLLSPANILLALRVLTIFFVILALADLRAVKMAKHNIPAGEADIVLALDISRSMMMEDIKPNRLSALKDVLTHFVAARSTDRFGVVLYAGESLLLCPLTKNYPFMLSKLNQMDNKALADGTAIGVGIASAVNALRQSKNSNKIIILLTDGENNTGYIDPMTAAEIAKRFKIKIYTIGIGTTGAAPMPVYDLDGRKTYAMIKTSIDEVMLTRIAVHTGGTYFRATDAVGLQSIYHEIDKLEKTKKLRIDIAYEPEYQVFLFIALALLLTELGLKFTIYRTWPV